VLKKLRIVLKGEEETEYTVRADYFEIQGGTVLHTWCKGGAYDRYDEQWFSLANVARWAWVE
jgi:hypothetical protein